MMVEMDKPFVWPEEPANLDPYVYHLLRTLMGLQAAQGLEGLVKECANV